MLLEAEGGKSFLWYKVLVVRYDEEGGTIGDVRILASV
jgi:hypothetical protein